MSDVEGSYDRIAGEYARRILHELDHKPFDTQLLDRFAEVVRNEGTVYDLGCGPGHVARYLHERGVRVVGVDLSEAMVVTARDLNPGLRFEQADMRELDIPAGSLAGIVCLYSIIHIAPGELVRAFGEMSRVLAAGAPLLLAFHVGDEKQRVDEWWGHEVALDVFFFKPEGVEKALAEAGFRIVDTLLRDPYPEVEYQSRRCYVWASSG